MADFAPTPEDIEIARSWVGDAADQDAFLERFDRLGGDLLSTIQDQLRASLMAMVLDQPGSAGTPEGLSYNNTANISALRDALKDITAQGTDVPLGPRVTRLKRVDYR